MKKAKTINELKDLFKLLGASEHKEDGFTFLELDSSNFKKQKTKKEGSTNETN